jgi:hypothetical protein
MGWKAYGKRLESGHTNRNGGREVNATPRGRGEGSTGLVEGEEAGEDRVVVEPAGAPVLAPAVGLGDRGVEPGVGLVEPGGALVVEVGQRALLGISAAMTSTGSSRSG